MGKNAPLLHRYVELRRRTLGLPDVHLYDLYVPLAPGVDAEIEFPEARQTILTALQPLGSEAVGVIDKGLDPRNGWLDIYPSNDKESGAFSASVYGQHPYVKMNYQNSLDDMSTLAHEYGHALHSHLTMANQPYSDFRSPPFLAVAHVAKAVSLCRSIPTNSPLHLCSLLTSNFICARCVSRSLN